MSKKIPPSPRPPRSPYDRNSAEHQHYEATSQWFIARGLAMAAGVDDQLSTFFERTRITLAIHEKSTTDELYRMLDKERSK